MRLFLFSILFILSMLKLGAQVSGVTGIVKANSVSEMNNIVPDTINNEAVFCLVKGINKLYTFRNGWKSVDSLGVSNIVDFERINNDLVLTYEVEGVEENITLSDVFNQAGDGDGYIGNSQTHVSGGNIELGDYILSNSGADGISFTSENNLEVDNAIITNNTDYFKSEKIQLCEPLISDYKRIIVDFPNFNSTFNMEWVIKISGNNPDGSNCNSTIKFYTKNNNLGGYRDSKIVIENSDNSVNFIEKATISSTGIGNLKLAIFHNGNNDNIGSVCIDEVKAYRNSSNFYNQYPSILSNINISVDTSSNIPDNAIYQTSNKVVLSDDLTNNIFFLGLGQSNAEGRQAHEYVDNPSNLYAYNASSGLLLNPNDYYTYKSPVWVVGRKYAVENPDEVVIISLVSEGGKSITNFQNGGDMKTRVNNLVNSLNENNVSGWNGKFDGIFFSQGEADSDGGVGVAASIYGETADSIYYEEFYTMYFELIEDEYIVESTPFIVNTVLDNETASNKGKTRNKALRRIGSDTINFTLNVEGFDVDDFDNLHYSLQGVETLGDRFYRTFLSSPYYKIGKEYSINISDCSSFETDKTYDYKLIEDSDGLANISIVNNSTKLNIIENFNSPEKTFIPAASVIHTMTYISDTMIAVGDDVIIEFDIYSPNGLGGVVVKGNYESGGNGYICLYDNNSTEVFSVSNGVRTQIGNYSYGESFINPYLKNERFKIETNGTEVLLYHYKKSSGNENKEGEFVLYGTSETSNPINSKSGILLQSNYGNNGDEVYFDNICFNTSLGKSLNFINSSTITFIKDELGISAISSGVSYTASLGTRILDSNIELEINNLPSAIAADFKGSSLFALYNGTEDRKGTFSDLADWINLQSTATDDQDATEVDLNPNLDVDSDGTDEITVQEALTDLSAFTYFNESIQVFGRNEDISNTTSIETFVVPSWMDGLRLENYAYRAYSGTGTFTIQILVNNATEFIQNSQDGSVQTQSAGLPLSDGDIIEIRTTNTTGSLKGLFVNLQISK